MDFCSRSVRFLSTPSARRATNLRTTEGVEGKISIHALREEGDLPQCRLLPPFCISIHALREEGDPPTPPFRLLRSLFLSTPSARRATGLGDKWFQDHQISIHALREEGDPGLRRGFQRNGVISIHALREEGDVLISWASTPT